MATFVAGSFLLKLTTASGQLATRCGRSRAVRLFQTSASQKQQHQEKDRHVEESPAANVVQRYETLGKPIETTSRLNFLDPFRDEPVPMYQVLRNDGEIIGDIHPDLSEAKMIEIYKGMLALNTMDKIMFEIHRQGRISFYMTAFGEEAAQFGSVAALAPEDWIFAQYREAGVLIQRGMDINLMVAQCYGNRDDLGKGRQMPIHYGNRQLNHVTISSPLATQLPQAVGTAYSFKRDQSGRVVICYFGEGSSSEGDAHAAMNFAATLDCPVIFFCRNNGYAISTPASEQYRGDGLVRRGTSYGMNSIRVDGNDLFAVFAATRAAREICTRESRPVLIEAMTYRVGHHSTSDDSSAYRSAEEIKNHDYYNNPIRRLKNHLLANGLWSEKQDEETIRVARSSVIEAINNAEKQKKLPIGSMFNDVYGGKMPSHLESQRDELMKHLAEYGDNYPLSDYESI